MSIHEMFTALNEAGETSDGHAFKKDVGGWILQKGTSIDESSVYLYKVPPYFNVMLEIVGKPNLRKRDFELYIYADGQRSNMYHAYLGSKELSEDNINNLYSIMSKAANNIEDMKRYANSAFTYLNKNKWALVDMSIRRFDSSRYGQFGDALADMSTSCENMIDNLESGIKRGL